MMEASLFEKLRSSLTEAAATAKGDRAFSRKFSVTGRNVQQIRESAGLTQSAGCISEKRAALINQATGITSPQTGIVTETEHEDI